jgi:hypothetical protein
MWLIKPKNVTIISTMQITIWECVPKDNITELEIKSNIYSPRAIDCGIGCSLMSITLSRSILVEGY